MWYVLCSKKMKEEALWCEATSRGYEVFYPKIIVKTVNPRARKIQPYFPGYMFVDADLDEIGLSNLMWMPYSRGCVTFGGQPAYVPESLIQAIRHKLASINATGAKGLTDLKSGDRIIIQNGPFAGYEAVFDERLRADDRVRVFLKFLRLRQVGLELPAGQIQKKNRD